MHKSFKTKLKLIIFKLKFSSKTAFRERLVSKKFEQADYRWRFQGMHFPPPAWGGAGGGLKISEKSLLGGGGNFVGGVT